MTWKDIYESKLVTAEEAIKAITVTRLLQEWDAVSRSEFSVP